MSTARHGAASFSTFVRHARWYAPPQAAQFRIVKVVCSYGPGTVQSLVTPRHTSQFGKAFGQLHDPSRLDIRKFGPSYDILPSGTRHSAQSSGTPQILVWRLMSHSPRAVVGIRAGISCILGSLAYRDKPTTLGVVGSVFTRPTPPHGFSSIRLVTLVMAVGSHLGE